MRSTRYLTAARKDCAACEIWAIQVSTRCPPNAGNSRCGLLACEIVRCYMRYSARKRHIILCVLHIKLCVLFTNDLYRVSTAVAKNWSVGPDLKTDVFLMNGLVPQYRTRAAGRGFPAGHPNAPINQYFSQSADVVNDRGMLSKDRISLQLRRFDLGTKARDPDSADIRNVTWFALHIPSVFSRDLHIEDRGA